MKFQCIYEVMRPVAGSQCYKPRVKVKEWEADDKEIVEAFIEVDQLNSLKPCSGRTEPLEVFSIIPALDARCSNSKMQEYINWITRANDVIYLVILNYVDSLPCKKRETITNDEVARYLHSQGYMVYEEQLADIMEDVREYVRV